MRRSLRRASCRQAAGASLLAGLSGPRTWRPLPPSAPWVEVRAGSRLSSVRGQVPDAVNAAAAQGPVERFGATEAQTRSVIGKIEGVLTQHKLTLGDVVMMRV